MRIFIARIKQTLEDAKAPNSKGFSGLSNPGHQMSARQPGPYDTIARKWLALAERRRAHLVELRQSGRWQHYFTEAQLADELHQVNLARDRFAKVAGIAT